MLRSPDLTPKDAQWVRRLATRTISEYNLQKSKGKEDAPEEPIAA
jgi:hypothetical protein